MFGPGTQSSAALDECDFLLFYVRGPGADSAKVYGRSGGRDLGELPRLEAWGRGCWNAEFDDPIVLERQSETGTLFRVIAVRPLRGRTPLVPTGDLPRAVIVPVAWLRERGLDPRAVELSLLTEDGGVADVEVTAIQRLTSPTAGPSWHSSKRGQSSLFPIGSASNAIANRRPRVVTMGEDVVAVFRGPWA